MSDAARENRPVWLEESWQTLRKCQKHLSDGDFLDQFLPILQTFRARAPRLEKYAQRLIEIYDLCGLNILEPASGCDVFPSILRNQVNCRVIGLEAATTPAARYCQIHNLPIITPPDWTTWTDEVFDLVVVTCYMTSPTFSDWGREMAAHFHRSALYQIERGAELVLFDARYIETLINVTRAEFHPIDWRHYQGPYGGLAIFYRAGRPGVRRIEAPPKAP